MNNEEQVQDVVRTFLRRPELNITRETTVHDVPGWDSLSHATIIMEIERRFAIEFDIEQIFEFADVGDMLDEIETLLAKKNSSSS